LRTQQPLPRDAGGRNVWVGKLFSRTSSSAGPRAAHDHTPNCGCGPCGSSSSSRGATFTPNVIASASARVRSRHECDRKGREEMREECGLRTQRPLPRAPAAVMFGLGNSFRGPALQPDRAVHDHTPNCGGGPCGSSSSSRGATFTPNVIASASARSGEATPRDFMSSLRSSWICDFAL
jgi:hypothetical protein